LRAGADGAGRVGHARDPGAAVSRVGATSAARRASVAGDGLSRTERQTLQTVAAGAQSPPSAFVAAQRLEEAPFLGDAWFYRALSSLGQGEARLVETDDGTPLPPAPPLGDGGQFARLRLQVTALGERVLGGDADRVELLGIDRWIGGTHVTPDNVWRWDGAGLKR
jgi:hypothetical protein